MNQMIILVTGGKGIFLISMPNNHGLNKFTANGGIGFEVAAQLLTDATKHVLLGSRSAEKGEHAVKDLQSRGLPGMVEMLQLDMTSEDSILAAAKKVEGEHGR